MYAATLKHHPIWCTQIPSLASPNGLNLRETHFETQDLSIPIRNTTNTSTKRTLRAILLTPTALTPHSIDETTARLDRFTHLSGGVGLVIIFLLAAESSPPPHARDRKTTVNTATLSPALAYQKLQSLILTNIELRGIPVLPLTNPSQLMLVLRTHLAALGAAQPRTSAAKATTKSHQLLRYATPTAPIQLLSEGAVNVITQHISGIGELAELAVLESDDATRGLREELDEALEAMVSREEREGVWEFWREEWAVE